MKQKHSLEELQSTLDGSTFVLERPKLDEEEKFCYRLVHYSQDRSTKITMLIESTKPVSAMRRFRHSHKALEHNAYRPMNLKAREAEDKATQE